MRNPTPVSWIWGTLASTLHPTATPDFTGNYRGESHFRDLPQRVKGPWIAISECTSRVISLPGTLCHWLHYNVSERFLEQSIIDSYVTLHVNGTVYDMAWALMKLFTNSMFFDSKLSKWTLMITCSRSSQYSNMIHYIISPLLASASDPQPPSSAVAEEVDIIHEFFGARYTIWRHEDHPL